MTNLSSLLTATVLLILLFPILCQASAPLDAVINEIAWMGTKTSYSDEWIEIYNNTGSEINLSGWKLAAKDDSPQITLSGKIPASGFYLLERTDDDTLPGITADQIYSGPMSNDGENFLLYDAFGNLIDSIDCQTGWFAGNNNTKQTMERKDPSLPGSSQNNWSASQNQGGTPKEKNSSFFQYTSKTAAENETTSAITAKEEIPKKTAPQENLPTKTYPTGIIFNEILPSPKGEDAKEEWIEIKNQNDFEIDLTGWKISDTAGSVTVYAFPKGIKIKQNGFLLLFRPKTKITLNNSGDGLKLMRPDEKISDSMDYENAPTENSYNLIGDKWVWSDTLTPNSANILSSDIKEEKNNLNASSAEKQLASAEKQILSPGKPLPLFLAALILAIISGVFILFFKKRASQSALNNKKNLL